MKTKYHIIEGKSSSVLRVGLGDGNINNISLSIIETPFTIREAKSITITKDEALKLAAVILDYIM